METVTERNSIQECRFEELLQKFAEPYIQCIAAKHCRNQIVGMEFEELCQEGRMKFWTDYGSFIQSRPTMSIHEFILMFKYDMTCRCLDRYRKVFSAGRSPYKVIDLDAMINSLEEDQSGMLVEILADPKSEFGVLDLETRDLIDYIKARLNDLEIRILDELINPSERLSRVMMAETCEVAERTKYLPVEDPALKMLNECCPKARQRQTTKTPLWHISVALGESYGKVRGAFDHLKAVASTLLLEETAGALQFNS